MGQRERLLEKRSNSQIFGNVFSDYLFFCNCSVLVLNVPENFHLYTQLNKVHGKKDTHTQEKEISLQLSN